MHNSENGTLINPEGNAEMGSQTCKIYRQGQVASNTTEEQKLAKAYYVCPLCGNKMQAKRESCSKCGTKADFQLMNMTAERQQEIARRQKENEDKIKEIKEQKERDIDDIRTLAGIWIFLQIVNIIMLFLPVFSKSNSYFEHEPFGIFDYIKQSEGWGSLDALSGMIGGMSVMFAVAGMVLAPLGALIGRNYYALEKKWPFTMAAVGATCMEMALLCPVILPAFGFGPDMPKYFVRILQCQLTDAGWVALVFILISNAPCWWINRIYKRHGW